MPLEKRFINNFLSINTEEFKMTTQRQKRIIIVTAFVIAVLMIATPMPTNSTTLENATTPELVQNNIVAHELGLGDYNYRRLITIGQESGAGTNYQINLDLGCFLYRWCLVVEKTYIL